MSDDGLLLNFSTEPRTSSSIQRKPTKIQGGRWKDRLKVKRAQVKQFEKENPEIRVARLAKEKSIRDKVNLAKEKRTKAFSGKDEDTEHRRAQEQPRPRHTSNSSFKGPTNAQKSNHPGVNLNPEDKNTFVSSLFSSNPIQSMAKEEEEDDDKNESHEASNAPLKDDTTFPGLGLNSILTNQLNNKMKIPTPTRIQRASLPPLISTDRDIFMQAQTGSGKTLAYVLPILQRLMSTPNLTRESGLFALIMAPTRELSNQIYSVIENLVSACHWIVPGIVIGGEKKKSEKARIRKGINILVATPGRLADHFDNTESLDLSQIRWIVLDEGDRLMELGFEETITKILTMVGKSSLIKESSKTWPTLPTKRVNVLCSATIRDDVKRLEQLSLSHAEWVNPESVSDHNKSLPSSSSSTLINHDHFAPAQLVQQSIVVPAKLRLVTLAALLKTVAHTKKGSRTIVFFSCSDSVDFHFKAFTKGGKNLLSAKKSRSALDIDSDEEDTGSSSSNQPTVMKSLDLEDTVVYKLHGSLNQQLRTSTLSAFSSKEKDTSSSSILFCTDVASRGLDLPHITQVIEYDPPFSTDDHVHRVGRTARAGHEGSSIIFILPGKEEGYLDLIKTNHPNGIHSRSYEDILKDGFGNKWDVDATTWHLNVERWLLEDFTALQLAKRGFTSHIRAYATHLSNEREMFNLRTLHLGHLAKSFALRETPGKMSNSFAQKDKKIDKKNGRISKSGGVNDKKSNHDNSSDSNRRRMLAAARTHADMSEFNLGY